MKAIEVKNISKKFIKKEAAGLFKRKNIKEFHALKNISFEVKKGEIFGVLGQNGCGKSTLIRCISTLLIPDEGEVSVFGMDIKKDAARIRRLLNRVSVDAAFYKKLSPKENLIFSAGLYGIDKRYAEEKALEILKRLGLREEAFYDSMQNMSRGMQQKVSIARAFLASPTVVLLDEPTTGLDPKSRQDVQEFILELRDDHDATVILTTHDMPEAERLCDRIAFMRNGEFTACDNSEKLKLLAGANSMDEAFITLTGEGIEDQLSEQIVVQ